MEKIHDEKRRIKAIYKQEGCPFRIYVALMVDKQSYQISKYKHIHTCLRVYKNPDASALWIVEKMGDFVRSQQGSSVWPLRDELGMAHHLEASTHKLYRARNIVTGHYGGVLLSTVSMDANCGMFPLAICICEVENNDSSGFFLSVLHAFLGDVDDVTFMSDRRKGILNALKVHWPQAKTRCVEVHYLESDEFKLSLHMNVNNFEEHVDDKLRITTYMQTYAHMIHLVPDKSTWPDVSGEKLWPPYKHTKSSRLAKERKRDPIEEPNNKMVNTFRCSICNGMGHNKRSCKENLATADKRKSQKRTYVVTMTTTASRAIFAASSKNVASSSQNNAP
ncbi:hypothetical protein Pint_04726 [Pistacia integerrima]|uniref:Uncharacterized protein n=1 Tax=Pistacia integerrima TaxID=434235 RepID=A0ACC0Z4V8_9ROSI|nr:hypothetical protein Pint_04726 [Pistacia integerrima]